MQKKRSLPVTMLNEHDRKIIDKYTKFYTNFIESNTARSTVLEEKQFVPKE